MTVYLPTSAHIGLIDPYRHLSAPVSARASAPYRPHIGPYRPRYACNNVHLDVVPMGQSYVLACLWLGSSLLHCECCLL